MTFKGKRNALKFIAFLERLIHKAKRPVFLILDGHPVHRSRRVRDYVNSKNGLLRLFILPPYSPHLNPNEWVWNWLKNHNLGKSKVVGPKQLQKTVVRFMRRLQKLPQLIRALFGDPNLAYITS